MHVHRHNYEHLIGTIMGVSSANVLCMSQPTLAEMVAQNLQYLMDRPGCPYPNANALGVAAGISPATVRNILNPAARPYEPQSKKKKTGYPTLDNLELIAGKLGCDVYLLLHPNISRALEEKEMYKMLERTFTKLPSISALRPTKEHKA